MWEGKGSLPPGERIGKKPDLHRMPKTREQPYKERQETRSPKKKEKKVGGESSVPCGECVVPDAGNDLKHVWFL
jgi:hypothetical protein